jgi:hypothetical protein
MTAATVHRGELPQLDEFEAERLDTRDQPVQHGAVDDRSHQQRFGARVRRLERLQGDFQRRRQPPLDPERVVGVHVDLPSWAIAHSVIIRASGRPRLMRAA